MKLMLRPEWRLWPLSSFCGLLDLKTGVTIALLFALLNKVAGVYGLIAVLTGAGGSFAQLSLYIYSALALVALAWGLRVVQDEEPKKTLYFAHLFFADHILSTSWTIFFALVWWLWTPHDGRQQVNSTAQKEMMELGNSSAPHLTPEQRKDAAMDIWNHEKGLAAAVIVVSWICKIYFALLIYSYALHLRKGSYRSLPLSRSAHVASTTASLNAYDAIANQEDEEIEDFYRVPLRTPPASSHRRGNSNNTSITSFADFVSAPGRTPRKKGFGSVSQGRDRDIEEEDVLFDEDDATTASNSSRSHSKVGTDASTVVASDEERIGGKGRR